MAQNQGNQGGGGGQGGQNRPQKQEPKIFCRFCNTEAPKGAIHCVKAGCGEALKLKCPSCGNFAINCPDGACDKCGTPLKAKPAEKAKDEKKEWRIEVTKTGGNGNWILGIQVTENGVGKKANVWIGHGTSNGTKETGDDGFIEFPIPAFTCKQTKIVVRIQGNQSNTEEVVLEGPPFQCPPGTGFFRRIALRMAYNRGQ